MNNYDFCYKVKKMDFSDNWFSCLAAKLKKGLNEKGDFPAELAHIYNLVYHPNNSLIKKSRGYKRTFDNQTSEQYDGLTPVLNSVFFSKNNIPTTGGNKTGGSNRGMQTDNEMYNLIYNGIPPKSKYALKTCKYLRKQGFQPFAAQFIVYDDQLKLATSIDILCIDLKDKSFYPRVVIIEEKTGFDKNYEKEFGKIRSPFVVDSPLREITDSFKYRHQFQILVTTMLFKSCFGDVCKEFTSRIIVISEELHSMYSIKSEIRLLYNDIYKNLLERKIKNKNHLLDSANNAAARYKMVKSTFCK